MKFLADENLNNNIVRGLFAAHPSIDLACTGGDLDSHIEYLLFPS